MGPGGFAAGAVTVDAFLGGRLEAVQPSHGHHRAGLEAILLASALDAGFAGTVVDLGAGTGVAGLAVAARCPQANVVLVERDATAVACARAALAREANRPFADRVTVFAAGVGNQGLRIGARADAVVANPPFNTVASPSPHPARAAAHVLADADLEAWIDSAAAMLKPGGQFIIVFRADRLSLLTSTLLSRFGAVVVLPIRPRQSLPAHRVLVRAVPGPGTGERALPPLSLHGEAGSAFLAPVERILRDGCDLSSDRPDWLLPPVTVPPTQEGDRPWPSP